MDHKFRSLWQGPWKCPGVAVVLGVGTRGDPCPLPPPLMGCATSVRPEEVGEVVQYTLSCSWGTCGLCGLRFLVPACFMFFFSAY